MWYALLCNPVAVDGGEVIIEELGGYSQGIEIAEGQAVQDQEPDLDREYDASASTTTVSVGILLISHYCRQMSGRR